MSEESPSEELTGCDGVTEPEIASEPQKTGQMPMTESNITEEVHQLENDEEDLSIEKFFLKESEDTQENFTDFQTKNTTSDTIPEDQIKNCEENFGIDEVSPTESEDLQGNSTDFRENNRAAEPVTVVLDPQEINKSFLIQLERRRRENDSTRGLEAPYPTDILDEERYNNIISVCKRRKKYSNGPQTTNNYACIFKSCYLVCAYLAFMLYLMIGTLLFARLEGNAEVARVDCIGTLKNDTAILLATELRQVKPYESVWAEFAFKHLKIFEDQLMSACGVETKDWRRRQEDGLQRWTTRSALFYSLTLMTRTSYCSMYPKSEWGRTATVCYSLFAIPLATAWFIITGRILAYLWSTTLDTICCYVCCNRNGHNKGKMKNAKTKSNSVGVSNPFTVKREYISQMRSQRVHDPRSSSGFKREMKMISMDQAVSVVLAVLFFVLYFVIWSASMAIMEDFSVTDSLYFNFLMLAMIGPTCSELENNLAYVTISNRIYYFYFLLGGYSIISMMFYLIITFFFPNFESYWSRKREKLFFEN